jgi:phage FluMu protein Com
VKHNGWMPECNCRGANPSCFRCSGTGVTGQLAERRNGSFSEVELELKAIGSRPGRRAPITRRERLPQAQQAVGRPHCPHCGTAIRRDRLDRHINKRCPKLKEQRRNAVASVEAAQPLEAPPFQSAAKAAQVACPPTPPTGRAMYSACPFCGTSVKGQIRFERHIKKRCPKLAWKKRGLQLTGARYQESATRPQRYSAQQRQAFFERSLVQGGLCSGR